MDWDLSVLYKSFEDAKFQKDMASLEPMIKALDETINSELDELVLLETAVTQLTQLVDLFTQLMCYTQLTLSVEAQNEAAAKAYDKLMQPYMALQQTVSAFSRHLGTVDHLEELIGRSLILKANDFMLRTRKLEAAHLIDPAIEPWFLQLSLSGGEAFSQLRDKLDATHTVQLNGEDIPLSAARGKAYDPDAAVRKAAYEAEIASYDKISLPMSYCLNSIKAEAATLAKAKKFDTILDMTLFDSNMDRETLDAMWTAIREYLPDFRRYLRAKANYLGHKDGLPFYDLFAPVGKSEKVYTIEEALDILVTAFDKFNPDMSAFIKNAFEEGWIDMYPKKGKGGGAFCAGIHHLGISRILSNFTGSFSDVSTLAHELGHAWHNHCMKGLPTLMAEYPMPLAETASIFNETMLTHQTLTNADADFAFALLESELMEATQTVVDIYSRYLFETEVIETRKDHTMSVDELKAIMLRAQDASYGDGLDKEIRHPYMWACKSHYYRMDVNFYNFPYAFGLLFGKGVFAQYLKKGATFVPEYNRLLSICGSDTIANVAASVDIDVRNPDFWRSSLAVVKEGIDHFVELCNKQ